MIHIQSVLSDTLDQLCMSPYTAASNVIFSIRNSNRKLDEMIKTKSFFGIKNSFYMKILRKLKEENGLYRMDKYVIFRGQIRAIMNMQ